MTRRALHQRSKTLLLGIFAVVALVSATFGGTMAKAAGYPPTTTTIPTSPPFIDTTPRNPEFVTVGSSEGYSVSGCLPNTTATFTTNGAAAGQMTTDASGAVTFVVSWGATSASVNGDSVPIQLGDNNVAVSCLGPDGPITRTAYFHLAASGGGGGGGGLAFTGAEIALMALVAGGLIVGGGALLITGSRRSARRNRSRTS